jgi:hypothetical protein
MNPSVFELENLSPEQALFEGQIDGLVVVFYQNERPPRGLAGRMDWYFQGAISNYLQKGAITGSPGECIYLPLTKNTTTQHPSIYHLILFGGGDAPEPGHRQLPDPESLMVLKKNLISLKFKKVGISCADLGNAKPKNIATAFEGIPLWTTA